MSSKLRSTALVLVLVTTTAAQALPLSSQARGGENFLETAWGWLTSLFLPNEPFSANLSKEGGMMDLNGFPTSDESLTSLAGCRGEEGGMMDPDGLR
jgi:hypothetical protein